MTDHKRLVMAISTGDVPRIGNLLALAIKQRAGPKEMIGRLFSTATALNPTGYRSKKNTDAERKLMRIIRVLRDERPLRLIPSVTAPKAVEIATNIQTFFGPASINAAFCKAGHCLILDGVHLSQRATWDRGSNRILGLCREHSEKLDLAMMDMDSVVKVAEALHGTNMQAEKVPGFAALVRMVMEQWAIHGQPHNGPLFTVGFEGDSVFRDGGFEVLMSRFSDLSPLMDQYAMNLNSMNNRGFVSEQVLREG
ncbi:hypothetical protein DFH09DRAFT_1085575 [Mycena vulgaris]|nr:hypothetical protein DFH09DRAFT_1085575 [Mycena vulgaris]